MHFRWHFKKTHIVVHVKIRSTFEAIFVTAVFNWKGDVRSGLPLEIGETVQILEEHGGNYGYI